MMKYCDTHKWVLLCYSLVGYFTLPLTSCTGNIGQTPAHCDTCEEYDTHWFCFPDTTWLTRNVHKLCEVKYYVSDDTLFTSEKYHFLSLIYSWNEDSTMAYQHIIFFDREQVADKDGWYRLFIDKFDIPREPDTHISGIVLRSYFGDRYESRKPGTPHADAYIFNATREIGRDKDRRELSPQLRKLYETIK